jgi:hypothetical protein
MNTLKRKALFTAVVAGLGAAAGSAEAVYLSPNNTGQVLIYPYYTVQSADGNSWNTYLSVVNTTTRAKAVKVRILEGKTSSEVLDFNLFLSANDVWTAAIVPSSDAAGAPGHIITTDVSCTNPAFPAGGVDFRNNQYATGSGGVSLPGKGLDRTREGYIEILEMGVLSGSWEAAVTHADGVPDDCTVVQGPAATPPAGEINPPAGGLMGTGTLINVNNGQDAGYKADALEAWSNAVQYSVPSLTTPNLGSATPATALVINAGGVDAGGAAMLATAYLAAYGAITVSGVPAGARAVASVYMHTSVMNEYVLDSATASNTDWVITQPLKNLFVTSTTAATPYTNVLTTDGACETVSFQYFDREERAAAAGTADFSPPVSTTPNALCWESNVLSIRNGASHMPTGTTSGILGSVNSTSVNVDPTFQNGWAILTFTGANATAGMAGATAASTRTSLDNLLVPAPVTATAAVTFFGLPVTGFMVRNFANGTLTCSSGNCQGNYGSLFAHSYRTVITP